MTLCGCAQVGEVPEKMPPVSPKWWTLLPVEPFKYQRVVVGVLSWVASVNITHQSTLVAYVSVIHFGGF